jgi:hypothetical protein
MWLGERAELVDCALFEGGLSASRLLGHRWPSGRRAESEEHARPVVTEDPRVNDDQVSDTAKLITRCRRHAGAETDGKCHNAMEFASAGTLGRIGTADVTAEPQSADR